MNIYETTLMDAWHQIIRTQYASDEALRADIAEFMRVKNSLKRQRVGAFYLCSFYKNMDYWDVWSEFA